MKLTRALSFLLDFIVKMIVDGLIKVGVCGVCLLVLLMHQMWVVLQRVGSGASARARVLIEVVEPINVRRLRLAKIVHRSVAVQQSGSVSGHAARIHRIIEVVWLLREIFDHVRDLGLEISYASSVVEQHRCDDAQKEHDEEDDPCDATSADCKQK